jgi:type I restriction enzyme S subunit
MAPYLSLRDQAQLTITLPPLGEQLSISAILSSLDDKIDLNREVNQTLEAIARTMFRSWFVEFDPVAAKAEGREPFGMDADTAALFPDRFVDSELGLIPDGWEVHPLDSIAAVVDCLHSKKPERSEKGGILLQVFNVGSDGWLDLSDRYLVDEPDYARWSKRFEVREGDIVITKTGRVGAVAQAQRGVRAAMGRNMVGVRADSDQCSSAFLRQLMLSRFMRSEIARLTSQGTILSSLHVKAVRALRAVLPPKVLSMVFSSRVGSIHQLLQANMTESQTLAELRDLLLPKLLSGEICIPEAEEIVEDTA